jgi:Protein of unknown function, DUF481
LRDEHQELDIKGGIAYTHQSFEDVQLPSVTLPDNTVVPGALVPVASKSLIGASLGETYSRNFAHGIALHEGLTFIPSFNDSRYYTANDFINLAIPVSKRFGITLGGIHSFINVPPGGFKKNSFEFITQLSYKIN